MVTADPQRTPSFTLFANPDYFLTAGKTATGAPSKFNCPDSAHQAFVCIDYHFAWSHGDATEDIGRTWLGMAGPGVKHLGITSQVWSDHTDIQPTILSLLGLQGQLPDGRPGAERVPREPREPERHGPERARLDLQADQRAVRPALVRRARGFDAGARQRELDRRQRVHAISDRIAALTSDRDALAGEMRDVLNEAAFGGAAAQSGARSTTSPGRQDDAHAGPSARSGRLALGDQAHSPRPRPAPGPRRFRASRPVAIVISFGRSHGTDAWMGRARRSGAARSGRRRKRRL